jgi:hypothetical protein
MGNTKTTVEINGVDVTDGFNLLTLHDREKDKALESLEYLLNEHFDRASETSIAGKFAIGFSLTFDRMAGRTSIKAKVSYSRKFTDELEAFAQLGTQGDLFGEDP